MGLIQLAQSFANADHDVMIFQKLQKCYQVSLIKNLYVTSFLNRFLNFSEQIKERFKLIPTICDLYLYYII